MAEKDKLLPLKHKRKPPDGMIEASNGRIANIPRTRLQALWPVRSRRNKGGGRRKKQR